MLFTFERIGAPLLGECIAIAVHHVSEEKNRISNLHMADFFFSILSYLLNFGRIFDSAMNMIFFIFYLADLKERYYMDETEKTRRFGNVPSIYGILTEIFPLFLWSFFRRVIVHAVAFVC